MAENTSAFTDNKLIGWGYKTFMSTKETLGFFGEAIRVKEERIDYDNHT